MGGGSVHQNQSNRAVGRTHWNPDLGMRRSRCEMSRLIGCDITLSEDRRPRMRTEGPPPPTDQEGGAAAGSAVHELRRARLGAAGIPSRLCSPPAQILPLYRCRTPQTYFPSWCLSVSTCKNEGNNFYLSPQLIMKTKGDDSDKAPNSAGAT